MNIKFIEEAQKEFFDAILYYEEAKKGLGKRFKNEVERCIQWISIHVELYPLRAGGYRRMNCRIFPYYIAYMIRDSTLWIIAIAHAHRKPEYWIKRQL